jgi:hypothetical protein
VTKRRQPKDRSRRADAEQGRLSATDRAAALKSQWTRLRQRHVLVGGACACGHGQNHMGPDDFEYFVLDHLARKYRAADQAKLLRFLEHGAGGATVQSLLDRLARPDARPALSATEAALLMDDLQRSLESFADSAI